MKKGLLIAYILVGVLFLFGILGTVFLLKPSDLNTVQISRDGEIIYTIVDLKGTADQFIRFDYGDSYNIIEIKDGRIRVSEAGCKDNTCVKMGWLTSSAPVVCLPNHLVLTFAEDYSGIDAVAR